MQYVTHNDLPHLHLTPHPADPNERQFAPGKSDNTVPSTPAALESAWRVSSQFRILENERVSYEKYMETERHDQEAFRTAVLEDKKKGVSKKSPYTLSFVAQVKALTIRQFQLRFQDRFQLYTSFSMSIVRFSPRIVRSTLLTVVAGPRYCSWGRILQPSADRKRGFHTRQYHFHR